MDGRLKRIADNSFTNFLAISEKHFKYRIKYVKSVLYEEIKNCRHNNTHTDGYGRIWCIDCKRFLYQ
jgi:hypothetical protein